MSQDRKMKDYGTMLNSVHAPKRLQEDVIRRAAISERIAHSNSVLTRRSQPKRRHALVACAACLVLLASFGIVGVLTTGSGADAPADGGSAYSFTLAAYADEKQDANALDPTALSVDDFFLTSAGTGYHRDENNKDDTTCLDVDRTYDLNLTCVGDGIRNISYSVASPDIYFSNWRSAEGPDVDLNDSQRVIEDRTEGVEFSVDNPEGGSLSTRSILVLRYTTDSEESVDAYTELQQLSRSETNTTLMRKEEIALMKEDAEHFSQTLFTVKASFEDGVYPNEMLSYCPGRRFRAKVQLLSRPPERNLRKARSSKWKRAASKALLLQDGGSFLVD